MTALTADLRVTWALMRRGLNEILRVPGASIPGILAPTIFLLGMAAVFGEAVTQPEYGTTNFTQFILPVSLIQGAGFTGAATGVNLARDIERGWFDRLLLAPAPRPIVLLGLVGSASLRCLLPTSFLLLVAFTLGVPWPGAGDLVVCAVFVMGFAATMACWGTVIALRFQTQQAAPLMQAVAFVAALFTTAYAPMELLAPWLQTVAKLNPTTQVIDAMRDGFISTMSWDAIAIATLAIVGMLLFFGALAMRGMHRLGR
ncbi:MAG: ABC transporter permease [Solirubrobacteraceae bacterium]|nr:ABC transporter permease [Solirubrobacteraceae bacterium]